MSTEGNIVTRVYVGDSPKKYLSHVETAEIIFSDFANLPHEVGDFTDSPTFFCHGREWIIKICPGGVIEYFAGKVGLICCLKGEDRNVKAKQTFRIPAANASGSGVYDFKAASCIENAYGNWNVCTRDSVLSSLDEDGALVVYADIQIYTDGPPDDGKPKETLRQDISKLFESSQLKDVTFSVGGTTVEAHRLILLARAPALAAITEDVSAGTPIPLDGIEGRLFKSFLSFLYTDDAPEDIKIRAFDYLELADRYGCEHLKLLAESELKASLRSNNSADLLLLADAKNCTRLKESALFFIASHHGEVMDTTGWTNLSKSLPLLNEIMAAMKKQTDKARVPKRRRTT